MDVTRKGTALALLVALAVTAGGGVAGCRRQAQRPSPQPEPEPAVWPLTGEEAPDEGATRARIVSVKIENSPAARPQAGLNEADIVYELVTEGGITRFHAVFHSQAPDRVGPVRSARPPDLTIVQQYGSVLLYSGANRVVKQQIEESNIDALTETTGARALERSAQRRAPHNLYANVGTAREVAEERGYEAEQDAPQLLFGAAPSAAGTSAAEAEIPFNGANQVVWTWDAEARRYARGLNGEAQVDEETNEPFQAANVVVLFAEFVEGDRPGTNDFRLETSGDVILFRDGKRFEGEWRASQQEPPRFSVDGGEDLPLALGPTWIEVLPAEQRAQFD